MNKVIITMTAIIVILSAIIIGMNIYKEQEYAKSNNQSNEEIIVADTNEEEISGYLSFGDSRQETETLQVNSNYEKEETNKFVLRDNNGFIVVYKINEDGEEEEYNATDISVEYLTKEDQENLKNGITVTGIENMNQLLENFE